MPNPFFDTFLPSLTGSLAEAGPKAVQGMVQGEQLARQLALLDLQQQGQRLTNQQALQALAQPKPQAQFHNLGAGAFARTDLQGNLIGDVNRPPEKPHYFQPITGEPGQQIFNPNTGQFTVVPGQVKPKEATIPQGYEKTQTGLRPISGGPADLKQQGMLNQDTSMLNNATNSMDRLEMAANELLTHPGLPGITGLRGAIPNIPGTAPADAQAKLEQLKSQVGFSVLQEMRNNSKTGGALGNVSDKETALLQSNLAALSNAQSYEQFQKSLRDIVAYTNGAKERLRAAYNMKHSAGAPSRPTAPTQPQGQPAQPQQSFVTVGTKEQYDKLPKGSRYRKAGESQIRVKQ